MTSAALAELVRDAAVQVLSARDLDTSVLPAAVTVERPRNPEHGHYVTNVAMAVAKKIGVPPRTLATWLSEALTAQDTIHSVDVAGPGFVNLRLAADAQAVIVREVLRRANSFGHGDLYRGLRVKLEFPGAPVSVLDGRRAVVAAALGRILAAQGAEIVDGSGTRSSNAVQDEPPRDQSGRRFTPLRADHNGDAPAGPAANDDSDDSEVIEIPLGQTVNLVRDGATVPVGDSDFSIDDLVAAIGADSARYWLVRSAMDSPLEIDLDLVRKHTKDNPLFCVQYAHARLFSLHRNAVVLGIHPGAVADTDLTLLAHDQEGELIRTLGEYPLVVRAAAWRRQPHRVARYLEDLAGAFDRFDDLYRVLRPGDDEAGPRTIARLQLCAAARQVLAHGLDLLGVGAPERM